MGVARCLGLTRSGAQVAEGGHVGPRALPLVQCVHVNAAIGADHSLEWALVHRSQSGSARPIFVLRNGVVLALSTAQERAAALLLFMLEHVTTLDIVHIYVLFGRCTVT